MSAEIAPTEKINNLTKAEVTKADLDQWFFGSQTKLTEAQKALFYQIAISCQLNPVKREVYAVPYGNTFNVIVGYEVYLKRAERTGKLEWWEAGVRKEGSELVGYCTIKRCDRSKETTIEAWFNEYNQNNAMWRTKPRTMIRKVAIAQAFRMVFPEELGGLPYTSAEIATDTVVDLSPQPEKEPSIIEKTIAKLQAVGKLANAEKFLGKPSYLWDEADVEKIEKAKKGKKTEAPQAPSAPDLPEANSIVQDDPNKPTTGKLATPEQCAKINDLLELSGMPYEVLLEDYNVHSLDELDVDTAYRVIDRLAAFPME